MNKSLDNKEEITYRSAKDRKNTEKYKRVTGFLEIMVNQKDDRKTVYSASPSSLWEGREAEASTSR
jgi:hypothetical protein